MSESFPTEDDERHTDGPRRGAHLSGLRGQLQRLDSRFRAASGYMTYIDENPHRVSRYLRLLKSARFGDSFVPTHIP